MLRQRQGTPRCDNCFNASAGKGHIGVFLLLLGLSLFCKLLMQDSCQLALGISPCDGKAHNAVADTKNVLVGVARRGNGKAIQGACHDPKRVEPAFGGFP